MPPLPGPKGAETVRAPSYRVVLVGPENPLNIGFVARAMRCFGATDLVIASSTEPRETVRQSARESGLKVTETVSFPSVALYRDTTLLTEVKAVSAGYPLRGRLKLAAQPLGEEFTVEGIPAPGEAWVEARVLQQLGAAIGDVIRLGDRGFTASRVLSYEPDRGGDLFQLAPRVLLNAADLPSTGLITPASRVRYRLLVASLSSATRGGATLADVVRSSENLDRTLAETRLGPFALIRKARFYVDQEKSVEIDLHAVHEDDDGTDLMIEVKGWEREPSEGVVRRFVEVKAALGGQLKRETVFLFYSESGLSDEAAALLHEAGVLVLDPEKLAGFEAF